MPDIAAFIKTQLTLAPAKAVPEIMLYQAHPKSGLTRFLGPDAPAPYWAYGWAGGNVLARYILDRPSEVAGKRLLDLGTGSGLVAIAAAKVGAQASAVDCDPHAIVAAQLNAAANGVEFHLSYGDAFAASLDGADVITMGDLFYDEALARQALAFARRARQQGTKVLIGDPGRKTLPQHALRKIAEYSVPDFGQSIATPAAVWTLA